MDEKDFEFMSLDELSRIAAKALTSLHKKLRQEHFGYESSICSGTLNDDDILLMIFDTSDTGGGINYIYSHKIDSNYLY